jgi:5-methylcytosine-specific restriction enzyme subunit McrC
MLFSTVNHAYREITSQVSPLLHRAQDCENRKYNRLNEDYQILHGLCRFFLEHTGPGYRLGDRTLFPFLIDMAALFEKFVAEWLDKHLGQRWLVRPQESVILDEENNFSYRIDLVMVDALTGQIRCVMDTKYKKPAFPSNEDINQVVAYAVSTGCKEAILVYPSNQTRMISIRVGNINVRSLVFDIEGDLGQTGKVFLQNIVNVLEMQD